VLVGRRFSPHRKVNLKPLSIVLVALGVSTAASADIVWRGNFETGDRSQWSGAEMVSADRLQVVEAPVREGRFALKAIVHQYDNPIHASGNRNELFYNSNEPMGSEYFYRWSTMFDASFPSHPSWNLFTQWHQSALCCGSPPVSFYVRGERIYLGIMDQPVWSVPLNRGVWNDFIFHVRWSDNPGVGFIELYYNGELVVPRRSAATNMPGQLNYLKQGLYRDEAIAPDGIVYHDAMVQATSLADVLAPPAPPQADAGTPAGGQTPDGGSLSTPGNGTATSALPSGAEAATGGCSAASGLIPALVLVLAPMLLVIRLRSAQRARARVRRGNSPRA
jgi:hypothetical protein